MGLTATVRSGIVPIWTVVHILDTEWSRSGTSQARAFLEPASFLGLNPPDCYDRRISMNDVSQDELQIRRLLEQYM